MIILYYYHENDCRNSGFACIHVRSNIDFQLGPDLSPCNVKCLTIEITRPRSKPFLVSAWYRPPQSSPDLFTVFERVIDKIDAENLELHLLGDLNCNLWPDIIDNKSSCLLTIVDFYGLTKLITEPSSVMQYSCTLIDFCFTNSPDKIVHFLETENVTFYSGVHKKCDSSKILINMNFYVIFAWNNGAVFPPKWNVELLETSSSYSECYLKACTTEN